MNDITYTKHGDKRVNNPTIENRGFFVAEEQRPYNALYPRDPSLDPQLVWKGKDEQDREDLAVPTVPIYIQEKIQPAALIEELRRSFVAAGQSPPEQQMALDFYSDFNGIESFDKEIEFYQHEKHWSNRMILGDSLLVMNSLAEKEGLKGKVQCIYIDPPYGIKFGSNWQVSTRKRDVKDGNAADAAREPEVVRAFRDTWKLGIHSYLAYLRDRFRVTHELLTDTGSIFVQIGDENVHLVRCVLDEVFGSENFVSSIVLRKTAGQTSDLLSGTADYILMYAKSKELVKFRPLFLDKLDSISLERYDQVELSDGTRRAMTVDEKGNSDLLPPGSRRFQGSATTSTKPPGDFPVEFEGRTYRPKSGYWKTGQLGFERLAKARRLLATTGGVLRYVRYAADFPCVEIDSIWSDISGSVQSRSDPKIYVVQTGTKPVERCLLMATDPGDLVLDPTCGSGTTAYVAEQWGRRWITIDTSRVALALARTRLMCARFPYYLLADSSEGIKREAELTGQVPPTYGTGGDIKKGFVCKRVPHVTLKSIANNPDLKEGMSRADIDKAIAKHAETELLYDQPYEDPKRVRVTGPLTVESLSPHRVLPAEDDRPTSETEAKRDDATNDFATMVIDNLKKSGVQNTKKGERLKFDTLEPFAGRYVHAIGTFLQGEDKVIRVAVSIGPEYGAVSPMQVKEAAKEAVQGLGHDVLIICGYAFDPHVNEEAKQYGSLTVLPTRMNADLLMGDDLLKKTGSGNLFMVFGEPDIEITGVLMDSDLGKGPNGKFYQAELRGLDVYDPTTGEIRSNSTNDIACWFIDTNYNGESFFVRHAYFVGAEITDKRDGQKYDPYRALRATLRAEIDQDAWSTLYSTVSRLFPPPETGKIAIKVINHYGDEVLKIYDVRTR